MLSVLNFINPKTGDNEIVTSIEDAHDKLDHLLLDSDQIEKMVGHTIDWESNATELFDKINSGHYGKDVKDRFILNCEAAMILAMANQRFMVEENEAVINA